MQRDESDEERFRSIDDLQAQQRRFDRLENAGAETERLEGLEPQRPVARGRAAGAASAHRR